MVSYTQPFEKAPLEEQALEKTLERWLDKPPARHRLTSTTRSTNPVSSGVSW